MQYQGSTSNILTWSKGCLYIRFDLIKITYDNFNYQGQVKIEAELKSESLILLNEGTGQTGSLDYRETKGGLSFPGAQNWHFGCQERNRVSKERFNLVKQNYLS